MGDVAWYSEQNELSPALLAGWSQAATVEDKLVKLTADLLALSYGAKIPRRLGNVSSEILAQDKKRFRKSTYLLRTMHGFWAALADPPWPEPDLENVPQVARQLGAQLVWDDWAAQRVLEAEHDRAQVVTASVQKGDRAWARKVGNLYTREINELIRLSDV